MAKAIPTSFNFVRYLHTQTRKAVTATAGVGAIVESPTGAYKIENLNNWMFFNKDVTPNYEHTDDEGRYVYELRDERLLNRLRGTGLFQNLIRLITVPPNVQDEKHPLLPADKKTVGRVDYFPTWFFCERCARFKPLSEWWEGWKMVMETKENTRDLQKIKSRFFYDGQHTDRPNCFHCYDELSTGTRRKYHKLEQVRFVFVAPNGDIRDIDWPRWITHYRADANTGDDTMPGKLALGQAPCCDIPDLRYVRSQKLSELAGIGIECLNCKRTGRTPSYKSLAGFFNLRMRRRGVPYKPLIRTSNSIYYPIVMSSLYIPQGQETLTKDQQNSVRSTHAAGRSAAEIAAFFNIPLLGVQRALGQEADLTEGAYRRREFQYLIGDASNNDSEQDLIVADISMNQSLEQNGFQKLMQVKRLKLTTVQTAYTRLAPMDRDVFASGTSRQIPFDDELVPLVARYTVSNPVNTEYLMGVENFGEGIFLQWDATWLSNNVNEYLADQVSNEEMEILFRRFGDNEMLPDDKFGDIAHLISHVFIHSFSHLIIKELEFLCGYPSSSVAERIYCDGEETAGLLIYTISGSEGSFGGLIEQVSTAEKFSRLLDSALYRAMDCPSDPICQDSTGQGIGGLNLAACYSCLLISETSCEEFNSFLDRKVLLKFMKQPGATN